MSVGLTPAERLVAAEREAAVARDRLTGTLATLQDRLDPRAMMRETRALATETVRDMGDRGSAVAQASLETARRNPGAVAGVAAGLGLFVIGRPLVRLFRRPAPLPPSIDQAPPPPPETKDSTHD